MEETWKDSGVGLTQSQKQIRRDRWSKDYCHLKNAELETKHPKYKGRIVLPGDIVKDDSGSFAVRTGQGSPASQMTAAKVMDIVSRLPGCAGQAADAVSAYTQVKMEDAPILLKIPKSECPDIWIRLPRHKWPKSWSSMEDPVVPLELILYGHPLAGLIWEGQFEKILFQHGWEKVSNWECLFVNLEKGYYYVCVDDIKFAGKNPNINSMWKVLNKEVDLGEPTSFLDHVYLGCTQRECDTSNHIFDTSRTMFESRISAAATEKLPCLENMSISPWSYDMEGHAMTCVVRYCELANKTTQQLYKVSPPCIDDHHFKEEELKSVGELSKVCSQIVLKCLYLARIGRPDILWSVNKLARSITKWTKACDKRLNRLISNIHHTCEYRQYCHVSSTAQQCRLGLFQDSVFARDLEDWKSTSDGTLCIFGSHTFVPISWMCEKQTSVSHSSTESKIISLDAGLRMDGIPALDLWDLIVTVLHGNTNQSKQVQGDLSTSLTRKKKSWKGWWSGIVLILFPQTRILLIRKLCCTYLKTTKQWSRWLWREEVPTMSHVSRTHRVALDRLFDGINLDPKIQIKIRWQQKQTRRHFDKRNFQTWWVETIFCVFFNISHSSSITKCKAMSKRTQEDDGEEGVTAKSKPMTNLMSWCRVRDPAVLASTASENPGNAKSESQNVPLSSLNVQQTGTAKPVKSISPIQEKSM